VDSDQQVAVAEGEVMLSGVALHPSDIASTDSAGRTTVQRGVSVTEAFAWTQGVLAFRDTPLRDVVRALSRTYDLDVSVADPALAAKLVTASFNNRTAEEVLTAVSLAVGGHVERTGRTAVIRDGIAQTGTKSRAGTEQRITRAEAKQ
jgi:ferric-dicitrate binding protein FerR (iron transport regulator)